MAYHKVRCWLDVVLEKIRTSHPKLVGHDDGIADFIELRVEGVGCELTIEQAVARHRAVRTLLLKEQEFHDVTRRREITIKLKTRPCLVDVACKDLAVGAEEEIVGVASRDGLAPR